MLFDENRAKAAAAKAAEMTTLVAPLQTWLTVHGFLCLALRHPDIPAASRDRMLDFVKKLGNIFVVTGLLTEFELSMVERVEEQERQKAAAPVPPEPVN